MAKQREASRRSLTEKGLLVVAVSTAVLVVALLVAPALLGIDVATETFYDGIIGAVAGALIGAATAVGITIYVLRRSLEQQASLHGESMETMRQHHVQMLRQQARSVRVQETFEEATILATATRRLEKSTDESSKLRRDAIPFGIAAQEFIDRAHHIEMENAIREVEELAALAAVEESHIPELQDRAGDLYFMLCAYMRGESLSGIETAPVPFEPERRFL